MSVHNSRIRAGIATAAGSPVTRTIVRCLIGCAITALTGRISAAERPASNTCASGSR